MCIVFSTLVEVFLDDFITYLDGGGLLHARGGVSKLQQKLVN